MWHAAGHVPARDGSTADNTVSESLRLMALLLAAYKPGDAD